MSSVDANKPVFPANEAPAEKQAKSEISEKDQKTQNAAEGKLATESAAQEGSITARAEALSGRTAVATQIGTAVLKVDAQAKDQLTKILKELPTVDAQLAKALYPEVLRGLKHHELLNLRSSVMASDRQDKEVILSIIKGLLNPIYKQIVIDYTSTNDYVGKLMPVCDKLQKCVKSCEAFWNDIQPEAQVWLLRAIMRAPGKVFLKDNLTNSSFIDNVINSSFINELILLNHELHSLINPQALTLIEQIQSKIDPKERAAVSSQCEAFLKTVNTASFASDSDLRPYSAILAPNPFMFDSLLVLPHLSSIFLENYHTKSTIVCGPSIRTIDIHECANIEKIDARACSDSLTLKIKFYDLDTFPFIDLPEAYNVKLKVPGEDDSLVAEAFAFQRLHHKPPELVENESFSPCTVVVEVYGNES